MRGHGFEVRVIRAVVVGLVLFVGSATLAQEADGTAALVAKAGRYVEEYTTQFSGVVGEERQTQRIVRADGSIKKQRDLVSDVLLVRVGEDTLPFRDVIMVDGKAVRDRQERLRKLFLEAPKTALKQAQAIAKESLRYNIGYGRGVEGLVFPLIIVRPTVASGFRFVPTTEGVAFEEVRSPSLIGEVNRGARRDMFLKGRLGIDPERGRVLSARLVADNDELEITIEVRYGEDATLHLLVPVDLKEWYRKTTKPKDDRLEVAASYGKFRRFQVTVDERIDLPK
jgi:hypothetical protein